MKMDGADEQSGLCEGEGERVGHLGESNPWFMAGSGDYMRLYAVRCHQVGFLASMSGTSGRISSGSPGVQTR
jgi:hypothetical protein